MSQETRRGRWAGLSICLFLTLTSRANSGETGLSELFAPPTRLEVAAVRAEWVTRNPVAAAVEVESAGVIEGSRFVVVSHVVDGNRHYGAVRFPRNFTCGGSFPVLLFNHGAGNGVHIQRIFDLDNRQPGSVIADEFFVLAPSYRSETLDAGILGEFRSEGVSSGADRDADDAIALLDSVFQLISEADESRVVTYGMSRGGNVSLHVGMRDERIGAVVNLFGATDFFLFQADAEDLVASGGEGGTGALRELMSSVVDPFLDGELTLAEARMALLFRSPLYFADDLPILQMHHGELDTTLDIAHSDRLDRMMRHLGARVPAYRYFVYPLGGHTSESLPGHADRVDRLISHFANGL